MDKDKYLLLSFSSSVQSDSLWPRGLQHARLPCPSPSLGSCSNSCPSSWFCHQPSHPLISCLQFFPASRSFNELALYIRWPKYWSFNFSISPSNEYSGLISLKFDLFDLFTVQETPKSLFATTTVQKNQSFSAQPSLWSNSYIHTWLLEKP